MEFCAQKAVQEFKAEEYRLKILSCEKDHWWYKDHIGTSFKVDRIQDDGSVLVETGTYIDEKQEKPSLGCVKRSDGKLVRFTCA